MEYTLVADTFHEGVIAIQFLTSAFYIDCNI
jgi:hypothetical protein